MSEENTVIDAKMEEFVSYVEGLTLLEASKLVKVLEERLGVSAAAPVALAAAPAGGAGAVSRRTATRRMDRASEAVTIPSPSVSPRSEQ